MNSSVRRRHDAGTMSSMDEAQQVRATIRSFRPEDQAACSALYIEGLIGKIADNDIGYDIDHIQDAYMGGSGSHFWVAESPSGQIVGTIGVQHLEDGVGEVKRLRVRCDYRRRGIGTALLETALKFCQEMNYLKVTLDTFVDRQAALRLFEKFRFHVSRTRMVGEKELIYFYLDIYAGTAHRHRPESDQTAGDQNAELTE
jgi:ribosomal protein S18 acetylase RimI-like enzyme